MVVRHTMSSLGSGLNSRDENFSHPNNVSDLWGTHYRGYEKNVPDKVIWDIPYKAKIGAIWDIPDRAKWDIPFECVQRYERTIFRRLNVFETPVPPYRFIIEIVEYRA